MLACVPTGNDPTLRQGGLGEAFMAYLEKEMATTPALLPRKSHEQRSLVGYGPWGCEESDTTERLHFHLSLSRIGEGNGNHSSILAWGVPGTEEPVGCRLWGRTESDTTETT